MGTPKTLLFVYHSMTDGTRQMVEAARAGAAAETGVEVRLLHAAQAEAADVLAADGYIFGTPENLAGISGVLKDFFVRAADGVHTCADAGSHPGSQTDRHR